MKEENTSLSAEELNEKGKGYYSNKEYEKAFECFKKSAEMGFANAKYNLYLCYLRGQGVERNDVTANQWLNDYNSNKKKNIGNIKEKLGLKQLNDLNENKDISFEEPKRAITSLSEQETRKDIHTIKSWVVFFGVLTVIELIIGFVFIIKILDKLD